MKYPDYILAPYEIYDDMRSTMRPDFTYGGRFRSKNNKFEVDANLYIEYLCKKKFSFAEVELIVRLKTMLEKFTEMVQNNLGFDFYLDFKGINLILGSENKVSVPLHAQPINSQIVNKAIQIYSNIVASPGVGYLHRFYFNNTLFTIMPCQKVKENSEWDTKTSKLTITKKQLKTLVNDHGY